MIISLSKVLEGPARALLVTVFRDIVAGVVIIPGKFFRIGGLCVLWVLVGLIFGFCSLGFYLSVILCP